MGPVPSVVSLTTRAKTADIMAARILENANGFMGMEFHKRNGKHPLKLESVIPKVMKESKNIGLLLFSPLIM